MLLPHSDKKTKAMGSAMKPGDKALGLDQDICRRDFLDSILLASGSLLLGALNPTQILAQKASEDEKGKEWDGPSGEGDYRGSNGNTWEVMQAGHAIRDGVYDKLPADTVNAGEIFDLVVVGGGISGLAAALTFQKEAGHGRTCLILENHPIFGGEAKRNEFIVDGHRLYAPQGSNLNVPPSPGTFLEKFFGSIGLDYQKAEYVPWGGPHPRMPLSRTSYSWIYMMPPNFGFYFGAQFGQRPGMWLVDPWGKNLEGAPLPANIRSEMLKWWKETGTEDKSPDEYYSEDDPKLRYYDTMTQEDRIIKEQGISREMIRMFISPLAATGYGLGCDALSARLYDDWYHLTKDDNRYSFPGGNAVIARHELKALLPDALPGPVTLENIVRSRVNFSVLDSPRNPVRMRMRCTVVRVEHEREPEKSDFVYVTYTREGKLYRLKARSVVMACQGVFARHVIRDLPPSHREAYSKFYYAAHLSLNVAVRNWRFLYKLGISGGRWFDGFGLWTEVRNPMVYGYDEKTFGPDSPTVLTLYVPFTYPGLSTEEQGNKGRSELLSIPFREFERKVREQFVDMFSHSGFDPRRDIAGIISNRWGHAFITPAPGFFYGRDGKLGPREVLRNKPFGRIAFGHSDIGGEPAADWAITEGARAARQLINVLA